MKRREFIGFAGVAVARWPLAARAKALGITVPQAVLARADEVIE